MAWRGFGFLSALLVLALVHALMAARFWFVCDDAFIAFTYSANLAAGDGLTWFAGDTPVEGYSCPLWVVYLAACQSLELHPRFVAPITSAACALVLWVWVGLGVRQVAGVAAGIAAMAFLALLPPVWVWSSGGLETMPAALALWAMTWALFLQREGPRPVVAGLAGAVLALLRPEGVLLALVVAGAAFVLGGSARRIALRGAALQAGGIALLAAGAWMAFRIAYHGDYVPQTVHAKGALTAFRVERGAAYLGAFLLGFPGVLAALLAAPFAIGVRTARPAVLACLATALAILAHGVLVGGDFMPMGRFFVAALPLVAFPAAVAFGTWYARRPVGTVAVAALVVAVSLPPAWNLSWWPQPLVELLHFRGDRPVGETEYANWRQLRDGARSDALLVRQLRKHVQPGDSLVREAIGVVGYGTSLRVLDTFGLVTRKPEAAHVLLPRGTPGHDRMIPWPMFLEDKPTWIHAHLARPGSPLVYGMLPQGFEQSALRDMVEVVRHPVAERDVDGSEVELRMLRFRRHDLPADALQPLLLAVAGVDPAAAGTALLLEERIHSITRGAVDDALRRMLAEGRIAQHGSDGFRWSVAADPSPRTHGFAVLVTLQSGPGLPLALPRGKFTYALPIDQGARLAGTEPCGVAICSPSRSHVDMVEGGSVLLVHLVPGGNLRLQGP